MRFVRHGRLVIWVLQVFFLGIERGSGGVEHLFLFFWRSRLAFYGEDCRLLIGMGVTEGRTQGS